MDRWIRAAIKYQIRLIWADDPCNGGLVLYANTRRDGGYPRYDKLYATVSIEEAIKLAIVIHLKNGNMSSKVLTDQYDLGLCDHIGSLVESLRDLQHKKGEKSRPTDWVSFMYWQKQGEVEG